jgi:hypothetical protein
VPTRWDVHVLVRAALAAAIAFGLAGLATAATGGGAIPWGERAGRALSLAPVCGAIGTWLALGPVRARGDGLALAALGRPRILIAAGAVAGGALIALIAAAVIGVAPAVNAIALFPSATPANAWEWQDGAFVDRVEGWRIAADGAPLPLAPEAGRAAARVPLHGRAAAAMAVAFAGLAFPLLLAHGLLGDRRDRLARDARADAGTLLAAAAAVAVSIALFQAAAARHVSVFLGAAPPAALLGFAVRRYWVSP